MRPMRPPSLSASLTARGRPGLRRALAALVGARLSGTWGWRLGLVGAAGVGLGGVLLASGLSEGSGESPDGLALSGLVRSFLAIAGVVFGAGPLALTVARGGAQLSPGLQTLAQSRGARSLDLDLGALWGAGAMSALLLALPWACVAALGLLEVGTLSGLLELGGFLLEGALRSAMSGLLLGGGGVLLRRLPQPTLLTLVLLLPALASLGALP
jgi:hypothetical protein